MTIFFFTDVRQNNHPDIKKKMLKPVFSLLVKRPALTGEGSLLPIKTLKNTIDL